MKKYADRVYSVYYLESLLRQEGYHSKMPRSKSSQKEATAQLDMKERDHWKKVRTKNSKVRRRTPMMLPAVSGILRVPPESVSTRTSSTR